MLRRARARFLLPLFPLLPALLFIAPVFAGGPNGADESQEERGWGHSGHGPAYDVGPRQRPWRMEGIGEAPFPITSANPEVQAWFDQGNALLHGFWWFEAERSFRWCVKLDPECAMGYWGLSRAAEGQHDSKRAGSFLEEASERKNAVTDRERRYIELYEAKFAMTRAEGNEERARTTDAFIVQFDKLLMENPEDIEAKALYWLDAVKGYGPGSGRVSRFGMEAVFQDVLERNPNHVGVLHYRIHNWDGKEGHYAVDSCMRLGEIAPNCGHLLHMPGHVLSGIGLWHEAAIAMDRATRVEKAYMHRRMILPEQNWDYVHNLDYLSYIQEQLGMQEAAIVGAKQLLLAPVSPDQAESNIDQHLPMMRVLVKFERFDDILDGALLDWDESDAALELVRSYAEARAHLGLGDLASAEEKLHDLRGSIESALNAKSGDGEGSPTWMVRRMAREMGTLSKEVEALLAIAKGDPLEGIRVLTEAAAEQEKRWSNDPPHQPQFLYNVLGEAYLKLGSAPLAAAAFEKSLETVFRDAFALSGLVRAHSALGNVEEASEALGTLKSVWSDADRPNRWLDAALAAASAAGIEAEATGDERLDERNYRREILDRLGPSLYEPATAPSLTAHDTAGAPVTLDRFQGKNVILIFYLGEECAHCMEQLQKANERVDTFQDLDTEIVAVSKDSTQEIAAACEDEDFRVTLLSDPTFESARRFHSFDEFEEIELHSTILIDKDRRVHWSRTGGDPFLDFDFLEKEVRRLEQGVVKSIRTTALSGGGESGDSR